MTIILDGPAVTQHRLLSAQVCVPKDWTDEQALDFLESKCPCGTTNGWWLRKEGDHRLGGAKERVQCEGRPDYVHIMFDA